MSSSIYIPRMCINTSQCEIKELFYKNRIGLVKRVDFIPIDKKPGFVENMDYDTKSAFVHFHDLHSFPSYILDKFEKQEGYKLCLNGYNEINGYWILLKADKPIKDTMMNIHQIVDNCRLLEEIIDTQEMKIRDLESNITNLEEKMNSMNEIIYRLLGNSHEKRIIKIDSVLNTAFIQEEDEEEEDEEEDEDVM